MGPGEVEGGLGQRCLWVGGGAKRSGNGLLAPSSCCKALLCIKRISRSASMACFFSNSSGAWARDRQVKRHEYLQGVVGRALRTSPASEDNTMCTTMAATDLELLSSPLSNHVDHMFAQPGRSGWSWTSAPADARVLPLLLLHLHVGLDASARRRVGPNDTMPQHHGTCDLAYTACALTLGNKRLGCVLGDITRGESHEIVRAQRVIKASPRSEGGGRPST